jgi:hypothetical protein
MIRSVACCAKRTGNLDMGVRTLHDQDFKGLF